MSNYTINSFSCRVDFFKPSGKWYAAYEVQFRYYDFRNTSIHKALKNALQDADLWDKLKEFDCICLKPYHKDTHPICIKANKFQRCY